MDSRRYLYPSFNARDYRKFKVCPLCQGKGTHVDPTIDENGFTFEDFYDDPDFEIDYRTGMYDVECAQCHGLRVIPDDKEYRADLRSYIDDSIEYEMEMKLGY